MVDGGAAVQVIDARYELHQPLGQGGMGVVWRAHDSLLGREVAIKEVRFPDILAADGRRALCHRLRQEARRVATLDHPAVVRVLEVVEHDERPFIVTELVEAPTLAQQVDSGGPLPPEVVAAIGVDLLDALAAAHARGLVHRFVQPAKVVLPAGGGARLADFGLAALIGDPLVLPGGAIGTVSYMAPEQHGHPVGDAASDVWSVAATLFYAVEGRPPYDAGAAKPTLAAIVSDPPRPLLRAGSLGPVLESVLVKDPAARPDVGTFRRRLAEVVTPVPAEADLVAVEDVAVEDVAVEGVAVQDVAVESIVAAPAPARPWFAEDSLADPPEDPVAEDGGVWAVGVAFGPASAEPRQEAAQERDLDLRVGPADGDGADDPGPQEEPEPPPLPPKVALGRMFSPDVERPPPPYVDAVPPDEPPPRPMWPLPRPWRPGAAFLAGLVVALLVFLLITGTRFLTGDSDRVARSPAAAVNWVTYTDPAHGFALEHPSTWEVTRGERVVDFRDPLSSAALRVAIQERGGTPEQIWLDLERQFIAEHPSYERIRLERTTAPDGREAAAWEFTWTDTTGTELHNSDLGMNAAGKSFALNFQTRADEWETLRFLFDRFTSSFVPPAG